MVKRSLKSALFGAGLGLALAFGMPNLHAQNFNPSYWTADGILVTPSVVSISRDKDVNIDSLIKGGNVTKICAVDPIYLIEGKLNFLNSKRAKQFYSKEDRERITRVYTQLLNQIKSEKRDSNYTSSLEKLAGEIDVNHRIITKAELNGLAEGIYAIDKQGIDSKVGAYDAPMLVYIGPKAGEKPEVIDILKPLRADDVELISPQVKQPKSDRSPELIFDLEGNSLSNSYKLDLGLRLHPFKNKALGIGILGSGGLSLDEKLASVNDSYYDPVLGETVSMQGNKSKTGKFNLGGGLEMSYSFPKVTVFGGEKVEYHGGIEKTTESISMNGQVQNSNVLSVPYSAIASDTYLGAEIPLSKDTNLGAIIGYNTINGIEFGLRTSIKLSPDK